MTTTRAQRATRIGLVAFVVSLASLLVLTFLPLPYVIEQPGPVFNTLGEVKDAQGKTVPLIAVADATTYPTKGALDLTTVQVVGNREQPPSWIQLMMAWFDPSRAVVPIDAVFPQGVSTSQRDQQNQLMMVDSQQEATAAALRELGHDVPVTIQVASILGDGAASGILKPKDTVVAVNGQKPSDVDALRAQIQKSAGAPVALTIERDGTQQDVSVTPRKQESNGTTTWLLGVTLQHQYTFPITVKLQLDNVGGPSAGMMFALGIIDTLTPGELNGGKQIAGTGTIAADGTVGPIGGIRQKLYGARSAGADYFLAPGSNCNEVYGHVPSGLTVVRTDSLGDSLKALRVIAAGGDVKALPTCTAADLKK
ncbi:PDZ domain-containing protein [Microbacterium sp. ASV81]|uniref:S16 family serine protease n=1 Tax=Microbacterium capsulatum TaxID=3041921 RepID=A0ABU0XHI4_9MICO|nr:S16 family serine protease [Microbacterium sp. ASV81]MDQ4214038.1 S16 family serine protease [Microbacterium sp. ASV81]